MKYYEKLFELYAKAIGLKITKENFNKMYNLYEKDFLYWLNRYKDATFEYRLYLTKYFNIDLDSSSVAELGKGNLDSVVRDDALMITPYGYTFTDLYHKNSKLIITKDNIKLDFGICEENTVGIDLYITQNPYLYTSVMSDLKKLNDLYNKNIILGMYGKLDDEDKSSKIKILKQFKRGIDKDNQKFDMDYNEHKNNYFCVITRK